MTRFDPDAHHRRSIRLHGYDYAQAGAYFVTVVVQGRACLFGDVMNGEMQQNAMGEIVAECWHAIPDHFVEVIVDAFIVMPNHIHGVVILNDVVGATHASPSPSPSPAASIARGPARRSIGAIVGSFKAASTKRIRALTKGDACVAPTGSVHPIVGSIWQRNYYEHVIRSDRALDRIREYIIRNPEHWADDEENLQRRTSP